MILRPRAAALVRAGQAAPAMPSERFILSEQQWADLADRLASDPVAVGGLWSDGDAVHALLLESPDAPLVASVAVEGRRVLALSPVRPHLSVAERVLRDLWGIEAMGALDLRPWLDHGAWKQTAPLSARPGPSAWPPEPPEFEWTDADAAAGAMQVPVGPVQSLLRGPAHLRVTLVGERVRRLEPLLGFNHRGVAARLRGADVAEATDLVGRIDAAAGVAHQAAFASAVEAAGAAAVGGGTRSLRQGMEALERLGMRLAMARLGPWRDRLLQGCAEAFGDRFMRGAIRPGGWAARPDGYGLSALSDLLGRLEPVLDPASTDLATAMRSDVAVARRCLAVPLSGGDPPQPAAVGIREGLGRAETVHGALWHWVRTENGRVLAWHAVDPQVSRLAELVAGLTGATMDAFEDLLAAAQLSAAGIDQ